MKPRFKAGQTWRTRGGELLTIHSVSVSDSPSFPIEILFNEIMSDEGYTASGRYLLHSYHESDLIELVDDKIPKEYFALTESFKAIEETLVRLDESIQELKDLISSPS